jgi:hypothetical protein
VCGRAGVEGGVYEGGPGRDGVLVRGWNGIGRGGAE